MKISRNYKNHICKAIYTNYTKHHLQGRDSSPAFFGPTILASVIGTRPVNFSSTWWSIEMKFLVMYLLYANIMIYTNYVNN
jgi:hypothetical protein